MSKLIILPTKMHKVANVDVNVKYRRPGNVVAYISTTFEIYKDGKYFLAIPLASEENLRLTGLPKKISFTFTNEKLCISRPGLGEIVEEIVHELAALNFIEVPLDYPEKRPLYRLIEF